MNTFSIRAWAAVSGALLSATILATCRGGHADPLTFQAPRYDIVEVRQQLAELPTPNGVREELFLLLKQALAAEIERAAKRPSVPIPEHWQFVVEYPTALYENGQWLLRWACENDGDYNQDGFVNISDITPLAVHFTEAIDQDGRWPTPTSQPVDGNEDGCVSILDITPLAASFGLGVASYSIEGANDEAGPWETAGSIPFAANTSDYGRLMFEISLGPSPSFRYFRVVPLDSEGNEWDVSWTLDLEEMPPVILGIHPWGGQSSQTVAFTGFIGGEEPLACEWDFGGGAEPNVSSEPSPTVALDDPGKYRASLTVSNALGTARYAFTLSVEPATWRVQTVAVEPEEAWWPTSVAFAPDGEPSVAWWVWIGISASGVRFAHSDGSGWEPQDVDSGAEGPGYTLSLAYDAEGRPAIAYESPDSAQLTLARLQAGEWNVQHVPGTFEASWSDLAFGPSSDARIVYQEYAGGLFFAEQVNDSWNIDTIEPPTEYVSLCQDAVDSSLTSHVMYVKSLAPGPVPTLMYAHKSDQEWDFETVVDDVLTFSFSLAPDEEPAAVYVTSPVGPAYLAFREEGTWPATELPRDPYVLWPEALAFLPTGEAVLAFSRGGNPEWLVVARQVGGDWIVQEVDSAPEALRGVDLAVSGSGRIAVSYETFYFGEEPSQVRIALLD